MKFLCVGCSRLEDVVRFRVDGSSLVVTCAHCGAENRAEPHAPPPLAKLAPPLPAPAPAPPVDAEKAFAVPAGHCPKCISKRSAAADACPTCGLVFAQATDTFSPSDWLKREWLKLLQAWSDDGQHDALRLEALNRGELPEIGRLYRLRLAEQPQDPMAVRGRDEVLRLAVMPQATMGQLRGANGSEVPRWKYIALSAVILGCLVVLFLLVRQMLTLSS